MRFLITRSKNKVVEISGTPYSTKVEVIDKFLISAEFLLKTGKPYFHGQTLVENPAPLTPPTLYPS